MQARLYNKTLETQGERQRRYAALLTARCGEAFDPEQDVWRLEFQLRREGAKGFQLYAPPEEDDPDEESRGGVGAEELQHIGTLPRFFARMKELFLHLTQHWLRLVEENERRQSLPLADASHLAAAARAVWHTRRRAATR